MSVIYNLTKNHRNAMILGFVYSALSVAETCNIASLKTKIEEEGKW